MFKIGCLLDGQLRPPQNEICASICANCIDHSPGGPSSSKCSELRAARSSNRTYSKCGSTVRILVRPCCRLVQEYAYSTEAKSFVSQILGTSTTWVRRQLHHPLAYLRFTLKETLGEPLNGGHNLCPQSNALTAASQANLLPLLSTSSCGSRHGSLD